VDECKPLHFGRLMEEAEGLAKKLDYA